MNKYKTVTALGLAVFAMSAVSTQAGVLASTSFDASSTSGSTKSNLNWTLNGLQSPGDLEAKNASGGAQNIFYGSAFVQDNFTPGLNVGNGNTFWTTDVSITVDPAFVVILEDVSFNVVSVNGGEALNVNRRNDYTLTLLNPSAGTVQEITIADTVSGNSAVPEQPSITFDFTDVVLNLPGTYILRIKGGDFTATDETGNHTGLDNLSINGTVVPEPSSLALLALGGLAMVRRRRG